MDIWIIPESDREGGGAVCQIWLQGGIHNETRTDKNLSSQESLLGGPPPFKGGGEGPIRFPE